MTSGMESVVSPFGVPFDFSPDGTSLVYVARPSPEDGAFTELTLKSINLASGRSRTLVSQPGILGLPRFSPDGKLVSYMASRNREPLFSPFSVFTVPVASGEPADAVPKLDRSITGNWMPHSQTLLLKGPDLTKNAAWLQELNGAPQRIDLGDVQIDGFERELSVSDAGVVAIAGIETGTASGSLSARPCRGETAKANPLQRETVLKKGSQGRDDCLGLSRWFQSQRRAGVPAGIPTATQVPTCRRYPWWSHVSFDGSVFVVGIRSWRRRVGSCFGPIIAAATTRAADSSEPS